MIIAIIDVIRGQSTGSDNYGHGQFYDNRDGSIRIVKLKLHCWTRYDSRIIVVNELKKLFGLYNVKLYRCGKYVTSLYREGDITLDNVDITRISTRLINRVRANFALRVCIGMRCNTEKSIVIRDDEPYSIVDKFPSQLAYCRDHISIISNTVYDRWFDGDDVTNYVHHFPIWVRYNTDEKMKILESMNSYIFDLMNYHECGYLHPYIMRNLRQGLLF